MLSSSPCGPFFFYYSNTPPPPPQCSSSVVSSVVNMSFGWIRRCFPGPGPHLLTSLCLYLFLSLLHSINTHTHTFKVEQRVHTAAQDGGRLEGWLSHSEATQNHIMYIIFSVCLHRHSIGVLGGGGHVNTTLTSSHLLVTCSCFIWASGSVKFWSSYFVFWTHFVTFSFFF